MSRTTDTSDDRGFTLVEIVVAIVLVGVLSAVVVVGVGSLTSNGTDAACQASLDAARTAATVHLTTNGQAATYTQLVDSGALTLPSGVTIDAAGTRLVGSGWTLVMSGNPPTFACEGPAPAAAPMTGYAGAVMADAPIAYWRLDETSGTTAADLGTAGATGTRAATAVAVTGAIATGSATSLTSGTSQGISVDVAAGAPLDLSSAFTVEAWISPSIAGQNGGIIEKTIGGTVNTQYLLFLENGELVWRTKGSGPWVHVYTRYSPPVNQWTHVVGTFDGTTIRVYANGIPVGTSLAAPMAATGAGVLFIGQLGAGAPNYAFRGAIDEVAVYGTALSAARVSAHHDAGLAPN